MLEYDVVGAGSMEIICPSCGTKYRIRDEKIRGKTVKMTCRKCSAAVYVRDPALGEPFVFLGRPPETLSAKNPVKTEAPQRKTKTVKVRWYAMREGKRTGPFSSKTILEKLKNGEITPRTMLWKPGLQKWKRAERIEDFQPLLKKFQEWVETQGQERTIISQIPMPTRETSSIELPPLPDDTSEQNEPASDSSGIREDSHSETSSVTDFFGTARVAAVSEAEIRASTERFESGIEKLEASDMHEIGETSEEKNFFTKVFQAPKLDIHEEDDPLERLAAEKVAPRKETLREFSVLMKIEQKTKKRNRVYAIVGISLIAIIIGVTVVLSAMAPKHSGLVLPDQDSGGKFNIHKYTIVHIPPPKKKAASKPIPSEIRRAPVVRYKRHTPVNNVRRRHKKKGMPTPEELAKAKEYNALFLSSGKIGEATVKVRKDTVASMPKIHLDRNGMNKFLQGKTKQLIACSRRKSYLQGQTVKVILQFTVLNTGRATSITIKQPDGLDDPGLFSCIKQKVRGWVFPKKASRKPLLFRTTLLL